MPPISRLMIRLSLVYLLVGTAIGTFMLINKAFLISPLIWFIFPIHIEFLIFGWIIQCTMGVAYWMLPRFLEAKGRGSSKIAWAMVIILNVGILAVAFAPYGLGKNAALSGRVMEAASVVIFILLHWNRIVTYNK
ncbi:MAG: hypothetical protein RI564_01730 [Gracilimonas sp.]|nr:hypothetical protein [Gracilimonas sp.]